MGTNGLQLPNLDILEGRPVIEPDTIYSFFSFLCSAPDEIFTVAFLFDESLPGQPKGNVPVYGVFHGKVHEIIEKINELQGKFGINVSCHVTLNRTNALGRKTKDIESARVLAVDLDGVPQEKLDLALSYNPTAAVESSEPGSGKFHLYWKLVDPNWKYLHEGMPLEEWKKLQLSLGFQFGGDLNLDQVSKTLRVPGIPRKTKSGAIWTPTFVQMGREPVRANAWELMFPFVDEVYEKAKEARKQSFKALNKLVTKCMKDGFKKKSLQEVAASGRNNLVYWAIKREVSKFKPGSLHFNCDFGFAESLGKEINGSFSVGLEEAELGTVIKSAFEHGKKLFLHRQERYSERLGKLGQGEEMEIEVMHEEKDHKENGVEAVLNGHLNGSNGSTALGLSRFQYDYSDDWLAGNSFTEYGLAARVLQQFGSDLCRCGSELLAFNEFTRTWVVQRENDSSEIPAMIRVIIRELREDERFLNMFCTTDEGAYSDSLLQKALVKFESTRVMKGVMTQIRLSSRIQTFEREEFDNQPGMFHVKNGLLNLDSGEIREVTSNDKLLAQSQVEYVLGAECPGWIEFLTQVFESDSELVDFIQEVFGYSIQGEISEQVIFCHYGLGANGKSRVLYALDRLTGGYCTTLAPDDMSFSGDKLGGKPFERVAAKIEGKRVVILDDLEVAEKWSEATVKNLTSKRVRARAEYQVSREIVNRAKVHLGLNIQPSPQAENHGLLRRLCIIPYMRRFAASSESLERIDSMIEQELSGILNWAIEGYQRRKRRGKLLIPEACVEAIQEYREENFDCESLILEMWKIPEVALNENFQYTEDLLADFKARLNAKGLTGSKVTVRSLGLLIRSVLGARMGRLMENGQRKRGFYLELQYERQNVSKPDMDKL